MPLTNDAPYSKLFYIPAGADCCAGTHLLKVIQNFQGITSIKITGELSLKFYIVSLLAGPVAHLNNDGTAEPARIPGDPSPAESELRIWWRTHIADADLVGF